MKKKPILWITETAVMLAMLIALQAVTKPWGQLVTGSFVNAVLAVTVLVSGIYSGLVVAVVSPVLAYLVGVAPQVLVVPAIMVGNCVYVTLLYLIAGKDSKKIVRQVLAWLAAAAAKFAALYAVVAWLICGVFAQNLGVKPPMAAKLIPMFSWPQLITALIGGGVALLMVPVIRKALHR